MPYTDPSQTKQSHAASHRFAMLVGQVAGHSQGHESTSVPHLTDFPGVSAGPLRGSVRCMPMTAEQFVDNRTPAQECP